MVEARTVSCRHLLYGHRTNILFSFWFERGPVKKYSNLTRRYTINIPEHYVLDIVCSEVTMFLPSCSRHGVLAARLASERPGSVIGLRLSKAFTPLVVQYIQSKRPSLWKFLERTVIAAWCARSAPTLSSLPLYPESHSERFCRCCTSAPTT